MKTFRGKFIFFIRSCEIMISFESKYFLVQQNAVKGAEKHDDE